MQYKNKRKKRKEKTKSGPQQPLSAKCFGKSCCHLHSTDTPFCDELDIDGSAKVNITAAVMELEECEEEEDDVAAAPAQEKENTGYKNSQIEQQKCLPIQQQAPVYSGSSN